MCPRLPVLSSRCPNPEDGTVELVQNGVSTMARFSFRMFTFTNFSSIYLHCQVHLCLLRNNNCTAVCTTVCVCVWGLKSIRLIDYQQIHQQESLMLFVCSTVSRVTTAELRGMYPIMTPPPSHWDHWCWTERVVINLSISDVPFSVLVDDIQLVQFILNKPYFFSCRQNDATKQCSWPADLPGDPASQSAIQSADCHNSDLRRTRMIHMYIRSQHMTYAFISYSVWEVLFGDVH